MKNSPHENITTTNPHDTVLGLWHVISCHSIWVSLQYLQCTQCSAYPKATAADSAKPSAADLPRPRAAVRVTVLLSVFSDIASTNFKRDLACGTTATQVIHNVNGFSIDNNFILSPMHPYCTVPRSHFLILWHCMECVNQIQWWTPVFASAILDPQESVRCHSEQHWPCNGLK